MYKRRKWRTVIIFETDLVNGNRAGEKFIDNNSLISIGRLVAASTAAETFRSYHIIVHLPRKKRVDRNVLFRLETAHHIIIDDGGVFHGDNIRTVNATTIDTNRYASSYNRRTNFTN